MEKKLLMAAGLMALSAVLASCGSREPEETTMTYQTAEATTEAPAAEEETEEETEAETLPEGMFEVECYSMGNFTNATRKGDKILKATESIPEIGETKNCGFYLYKDENGDDVGNFRDFKTISLHEWGINYITVDPGLFPDDYSEVVQLDPGRIIKRKLNESELALCGFSADEDIEVTDYDGTIYLDDYGFEAKDDGTGEAVDGKDVCVDLSPLYPGSLTRADDVSFFQTYLTETDMDLSEEALKDISSAELFEKLYPYGSWRLHKNDGKYTGVDPTYFIIRDTGFGIYIAFHLKTDAYHAVVRQSREIDETYSKTGLAVMRVKDGKCQGFLYLVLNKSGLHQAQYALGPGFSLAADMNYVEEEPCKRYTDVK